jgi:sensor histidine kinase YesM
MPQTIPPSTPRRQPVLWLLLSCAAMGALPGLVEAVFLGSTFQHFAFSVLFGFTYAVCIALPCWFAIPRLMYLLHRQPVGARVGTATILLGFFALAGCFVANLLLALTGLVPWPRFGSVYASSIRICLMITFTVGVLTLVIFTLQERLALTRRELHAREISEERERKTAAQARFASLESRVRPHFLFNTLNSISALIREDPSQAERMIERLSTLLRFSLDSELAGLVPLRQELTVVRDYLEIEKVRFGARLAYRMEVDENAREQMVPALSIQTLVENSVKYAVGTKREGAEIVVSASVREGRLQIEVEDNGPGFGPPLSLKPGHGLDLLQRRLSSLFGSAASLEVSARDGRTMVRISLVS